MDKTIVKGLRVLEAVARGEGPSSVTDLANELSLTKSNVHRVLQTLGALGYVAQLEQTSRYVPTFRLWELGHAVWTRSRLKQVASPHAHDLAHRTRETVHLTLVEGEDLLFFEQIGGTHAIPIRVFWPSGGRMRAWQILPGGNDLIAVQVALLALLPEDRRRSLLSEFEAASGRLGLRESLEARIMDARTDGFALNRGEWNLEARGTGAIFRHPDGSPAGGVGILASAERAEPSTLATWGRWTGQVAEAITVELAIGQH